MSLNTPSSDKPISKPEEDEFQRYNFSKRIAETISPPLLVLSPTTHHAHHLH